MSLCIAMPSGKHTFQTYSLNEGNEVNQTNNGSIYGRGHTDFLSSAIISSVYLLTELFLKSKADSNDLWDS